MKARVQRSPEKRPFQYAVSLINGNKLSLLCLQISARLLVWRCVSTSLESCTRLSGRTHRAVDLFPGRNILRCVLRRSTQYSAPCIVVAPYMYSAHDCAAGACRMSAEGKVCMIDAESDAAVASMQSKHLKAVYFRLHPHCEQNMREVHEEARIFPVPGSSSGRAQSPCQKQQGLEVQDVGQIVWDVDVNLPLGHEAAYFRLMEAIADRFPLIVPPCDVWGLGKQLWNQSSRAHGRHPLCVLILGPAAVGKTSVAIRISKRFGLLHINAGDLLFDEVGFSIDSLFSKCLCSV
jgi:hypothetical protein